MSSITINDFEAAVKSAESKQILTRSERIKVENLICFIKQEAQKLTPAKWEIHKDQLKNLVKRCKNLIDSSDKSLANLFNSIEKKSKQLVPYRNTILIELLDNINKKEKMGKFDLATAFKLEELSATTAKAVQQFITIAEFYSDSLDGTTDKNQLVKFLIAAKIKGDARTRLPSDITTFEELKAACETHVTALESTEQLQQMLTACRQGRLDLTSYAAKLKDIATRLATSMMRSQPTSAKSGIKLSCDQLALNQFKNGCHEEVKLIVLASSPTTLDDALKTAIASNLDYTPHTAQALSFNKHQRYTGTRQYQNNNRNHSSYSSYNSGQRHKNFNSNYNNRSSNNFYNNHESHGQQNNNSNSSGQRYNSSSSGQRYNSNSSDRRYNSNNYNNGNRHNTNNQRNNNNNSNTNWRSGNSSNFNGRQHQVHLQQNDQHSEN